MAKIHRCDGFSRSQHQCTNDAVWKVKRRTLAFAWYYACGQHLHQISTEQDRGEPQDLDLIRVEATE